MRVTPFVSRHVIISRFTSRIQIGIKVIACLIVFNSSISNENFYSSYLAVLKVNQSHLTINVMLPIIPPSLYGFHADTKKKKRDSRAARWREAWTAILKYACAGLSNWLAGKVTRPPSSRSSRRQRSAYEWYISKTCT